MAILIPDKIRTERTPSGAEITIKEKIIPDSAKATKDVAYYVQKGDPMKPLKKLNDGSGKPKGITIHNTGDIKVAKGTTPAEQYTRATWPNCNMGGAVVHFYVYKADIWQNLSESERGWHAADGSSRRQSHRAGQQIGGNADTIAIECIGDIPESEDTAAKLAAYLLKKYGLSPDTDLYTHRYFLPGKNCPLYILPHWDGFVAKVKGYYTATQNPPAPKSIKVGDTVNYKGRIYGDSYGGNPGATVSGTYEVTRVIAGRKCGVHLGSSGWAPESDCAVVKNSASETSSKPSTTAPAESKPAEKPVTPKKNEKIKVGDTVSYSGRLYLTSYGILPGKTVNGKFKVDRVIEGRKYGIHIPAGWIDSTKAKKGVKL